MTHAPTLCYATGDDLQRGDRVRVLPEGFTATRYKVEPEQEGKIGIVLRQIPFLNVPEVYFPLGGETCVLRGAHALVEVGHLSLQKRDDHSFFLPVVPKYAELELLASWMQSSVSSEESIHRYEQLTDAESIENLCMDYHRLQKENAAMTAALKSLRTNENGEDATHYPVNVTFPCGTLIKIE